MASAIQIRSVQPSGGSARTGCGVVLGSPVIISVLLGLATFLVYAGTLGNDFVNYDDPDYVTSNPHVQSGLTWANVVWAFTKGYASNWHPLTWLSHMLDCQLFGARPGPPHAVNLGLHIANSILLFLLLRRLTGLHWRSAVVAAFFALHPLHVESVAWVSERKDVLSTFFFLLTLAAYVRYAGAVGLPVQPSPVPKKRTGGSRSRLVSKESHSRYYVLALGWFALGLMSKPMLVTMPFVLLLLDYWPLGRLSIPLRDSRVSPGRLCLEKVPFLALSLASCVVTYVVQREGGAVSTSISLAGRIANAVVSYLRYVGKTVWPVNLSVLYLHPGYWPGWLVGVSAVFLLATCALAVLMARRRPYGAVGWFWFIGTLVPVIGLVQVGIQSMADRYTYLPLIGFFIVLCWALPEALAPYVWRPQALATATALALLGCAGLTVRQVRFWATSETLFEQAVQVDPGNYLAYNNLGFSKSKNGQALAAMTNYIKSLQINSNYPDALNNMGYALAGLKRNAEAVEYYLRALRVSPKNAEVHNNYGNALSELGRLDEAMAEYRLALQLNPEHADAHNNLGIALAMQGKLEEAIAQFQLAMRYKPNDASAHSNLGNAYAAQRKFDLASREYEESLRLNPRDPQAHNNLGNALAEQGRLPEAIEEYAEALKLNADNPEAHFNLGMALVRNGHPELAASHFTEALRLKPDYSQARQQLELLQRNQRQ